MLQQVVGISKTNSDLSSQPKDGLHLYACDVSVDVVSQSFPEQTYISVSNTLKCPHYLYFPVFFSLPVSRIVYLLSGVKREKKSHQAGNELFYYLSFIISQCISSISEFLEQHPLNFTFQYLPSCMLNLNFWGLSPLLYILEKHLKER